MKTIQIAGTKLLCLVDDEDAETLRRYKWELLKESDKLFYARTRITDGPKRRYVLMHRMLMPPPDGLITDHRDGDGLNNQRINLRSVTPSQSACNRSSKDRELPKGVEKRYRLFRATVVVARKKIRASFQSQAEAENWARQKRNELHGEFANHK
jgi:hypothetical protein